MIDSYRLRDDHIEPTFNLQLIEQVKRNRCLYDTRDRQYRSSEYKNRVWNRIVEVLHFSGDSRTLSARWKQLRDKYGKEKKKSKYNESCWQYYKYLHFLDPFMIDRSQQQSPSSKENVDVRQLSDPNWTLSFIDEVRIYPCLYDPRDAKYRNKEIRDSCWRLIIKKFNYPGDESSIYKQWKKLRDRYVREKRRIREQAGRGEESTWELFHHMLWMDPCLEERERAQSMKRKQDADGWSDQDMDADSAMGYSSMIEKRTGGADVLLDGDSAFAASVVSDLRSLSERSRNIARAQIEQLLENGPNAF